METKKCVTILAIIVLLLAGIMFINVAIAPNINMTQQQEAPTIIVNGNGSSGTGDVTTNTKIIQVEDRIVQGDTVIQIDGKEFARVTAKYYREEQRKAGRTIIVTG